MAGYAASARPPPDGYLSSNEVADEIGVTYRVLDRWVREGVVTPTVSASGPGSRRAWAADQMPVLRVLGKVWRAVAEYHGSGAGGPQLLSLEIATQIRLAAEHALAEGHGGLSVWIGEGVSLYVDIGGAPRDPTRCASCLLRLPTPDEAQVAVARTAMIGEARRMVDGLDCFCMGKRTGQEIPERRAWCARHWFLDRIEATAAEWDPDASEPEVEAVAMI